MGIHILYHLYIEDGIHLIKFSTLTERKRGRERAVPERTSLVYKSGLQIRSHQRQEQRMEWSMSFVGWQRLCMLVMILLKFSWGIFCQSCGSKFFNCSIVCGWGPTAA